MSEMIVTRMQIWHMSLDNTRNRTLQTNLTISIGSLALTTATLPAAIFGMNLHSGWEARCQAVENALSIDCCTSVTPASQMSSADSRHLRGQWPAVQH